MKNLKNKIAFTLLISAMASSFAFKPFKNGKVVMIIFIEVQNFSEWKKGFDAGASVREKAGVKVLSVCSSIENENHIVVIEEAESAQSAHDFLALLKSKQNEGSLSKLEVKIFDKTE